MSVQGFDIHTRSRFVRYPYRDLSVCIGNFQKNLATNIRLWLAAGWPERNSLIYMVTPNRAIDSGFGLLKLG